MLTDDVAITSRSIDVAIVGYSKCPAKVLTEHFRDESRETGGNGEGELHCEGNLFVCLSWWIMD